MEGWTLFFVRALGIEPVSSSESKSWEFGLAFCEFWCVVRECRSHRLHPAL